MNLSKSELQVLRSLKFAPTEMPRNWKGTEQMSQVRNVEAASKKPGLRLTPMTLLLLKLSDKPDDISKPISAALIVHRLSQEPSPIINVSSTNYKKSKVKSFKILKGRIKPNHFAFCISPTQLVLQPQPRKEKATMDLIATNLFPP